MDNELNKGSRENIEANPIEEIEEMFDHMSHDEMEFWSSCYTIAMKNVMFHRDKKTFMSIDDGEADKVADDCKRYADRALAKYREKKLDVKR